MAPRDMCRRKDAREIAIKRQSDLTGNNSQPGPMFRFGYWEHRTSRPFRPGLSDVPCPACSVVGCPPGVNIDQQHLWQTRS